MDQVHCVQSDILVGPDFFGFALLHPISDNYRSGWFGVVR